MILLFTVQCPTNFDHISLGCIHFAPNKITFAEAEPYCHSVGAAFYFADNEEQLAEIRNAMSLLNNVRK